MLPFQPFPKVARLTKPIVVTEKIDGTNASVTIVDLNDPELDWIMRHDLVGARNAVDALGYPPAPLTAWVGPLAVLAGSRKRWITPLDDNFGFARWVHEHAEELVELGPGTHYGEWYGQGIQRGYGLDHKRFALFNTHRWNDPEVRPPCCDIVPVLLEHHALDTFAIEYAKNILFIEGSKAAPGFDRPEGVMVYLTGPGVYVKHPFDPAPKGNS